MSNGAARRPEHAAARRAVARRLHPDRGGDQQEYLTALAEVDRDFGTDPTGGELPTAQTSSYAVRRRSLYSLRRRTRRTVRIVQQALPAGWPGARRYGQL